MTAEGDDGKFRRDASWRGAGADQARDRVIDALVAQGKVGAAARIAWEGDAEYREAPLNPRHRGYDPHVAERYASRKTVRRMR